MLNIKFMFCTFWDPDLIRVHQDNVTSIIWFMGCIEKKKVMSTSIEQFMTNTARNKKLEYLYLCSFYFNLSLVSPVTFWNCNTTSPESPFNSQYLLNNSAGVIFGPALSIHWPLEFFCFLTKKKSKILKIFSDRCKHTVAAESGSWRFTQQCSPQKSFVLPR